MRKVIGVYTSLGASTVFIFEPSKVLHFPRVHLHHHRLPGFSTRLHCGLHFCHKPGTVRGTPNQWRAVGMITWWLPPNSTNNLLGIIYLLILHTSSYKACLFATNQEDDWIRINHIAATFLIISFHFPSHFPPFPHNSWPWSGIFWAIGRGSHHFAILAFQDFFKAILESDGC